MVRVVISQPMYLPWAGFLAHLSLADVLIWLDDAQFSKGSFTNRIQIQKPTGVDWLSIPVVKSKGKQRILDLQPAQTDWFKSHSSVLKTCYARSVYYDEIASIFGNIQADQTLCNSIITSSESLLKAVGVNQKQTTLKSSEMRISGSSSERVLNLVKAVNGSEYITGLGAKNYLDHDLFEDAGVDVKYMDYDVLPWPQQTTEFTPYVSALDLVANVAPQKRRAHLNPKTKDWRSIV
ncbi:MAG: WbqC family protein [Amylibacter sp.]|jgi:hypothetical protein|nr:WbqC family protein [Amylibacter sp.]